VRLLDARVPYHEVVLQRHTAPIDTVAFSRNGERIVTRDKKGVAFVWDPSTGKRIDGEPVPATTLPGQVSPDGRSRAYRIAGEAFETEADAVLEIRNPDYNPWAEDVALRDQWAPIWHAQDATRAETSEDWFAASFHLKRLLQLQPAPAQVQAPQFPSTQALLASYAARLRHADDNIVIERELAPFLRSHFVNWSLHSVNRAARLPDGRILYGGWTTIDNGLRATASVVDERFPADRPPQLNTIADGVPVWSVAVLPAPSPDRTPLMIAGTSDGRMFAAAASGEGKFEPLFKAPVGPFATVGDPHGGWLALAMRDYGVKVYDPSGPLLRDLLIDGMKTPYGLAVRPDGKRLAAVGAHDALVVWNTDDWSIVATIPLNASAGEAIAYSADGRFLAAGRSDGVVQIWDGETQEPLRSINGHSQAVKDHEIYRGLGSPVTIRRHVEAALLDWTA